MARRRLFGDYVRFVPGAPPSDRADLPITEASDEIVNQLDATNISSVGQLNQFRTLAQDRNTQYSAYDEMKTDSIIAAALEIYADDATQYDEQGRIIWVESEIEEVAKAGNRLLEIFDIPERCWKHVYQLCTYGDYYLKLYRLGDTDDIDDTLFGNADIVANNRVVNDKRVDRDGKPLPNNYEEYVEDVEDPATLFDLRKRGKTAGFIEVDKESYSGIAPSINNAAFAFQMKDITIYKPDRFVHIMLAENLSRDPETVTIDLGFDKNNNPKHAEYVSARGKSILQDVYPIQKELQLLEDSLLLNRLTRSSLIRILEIELGDMPKKEINNYMRRIKNLIEQHIAIDKTDGTYKSFNAPGPIDNVIYIPVRNGKGSINVNNLGGDINVRDIADIDYFNNKRAGALKIPRAMLGDDMDGSGLSNGGSLTMLSIRYARTIKRIQTAYIRAITTLLNLFFVDKKLDYVNKFEVRMASPSTQEDLDRNALISNNIDIISNIMDLVSSLEGDTQKNILEYLMSKILKMPELTEIIKQDDTPEEDVDIDGGGGGGGSTSRSTPRVTAPSGTGPGLDLTAAFGDNSSSSSEEAASSEGESGGFTADEFAEFED